MKDNATISIVIDQAFDRLFTEENFNAVFSERLAGRNGGGHWALAFGVPMLAAWIIFKSDVFLNIQYLSFRIVPT